MHREEFEEVMPETWIKGWGLVYLVDPMVLRPIDKLWMNRLEEDNPVAWKYYILTRQSDDDAIAKGLSPNADEVNELRRIFENPDF